jgi:hypothetical protein
MTRIDLLQQEIAELQATLQFHQERQPELLARQWELEAGIYRMQTELDELEKENKRE